MNKILITIFLLVSVCQVWAQSDSLATKSTGRKLHYSNSFIIGGLFGEEEEGDTFMGAMTHGIRYGRLGSGVGIGVDRYKEWVAIPLYGYVSFDFARIKNNALAIQVSGGYSDVWQSEDQRPGSPSIESKDGGNFSAMMGYVIAANKYRIYIWCGYKYQKLNYTIRPAYMGDFSSSRPMTTSVEMDMNRFTIQLGFGWR